MKEIILHNYCRYLFTVFLAIFSMAFPLAIKTHGQALQCGPIYGNFGSGSNYNSLRIFNPSAAIGSSVGNQITQLSVNPSYAGAISPTTKRYYYIAANSGSTIYYYDGATNTHTSTGRTVNVANIYRMAADANGKIYITNDVNALYIYDPVTNTVSGPVTIADNSSNPSTPTDQRLSASIGGDFAFDSSGNAFLVTYNSGLTEFRLFRITGLPSSPLATLIGTAATTNNTAGIAFGTDGFLYLQHLTGNTKRWNLATNTVTDLGTANLGSGDLASCNLPSVASNVAATKTVSNLTRTGTTQYQAGDVLEYTITVTNSGNLAAGSATLADAIPTGTTYVANSTKLNGTTVTDNTGSVMPYATTKEIHTNGQPGGVLLAGAANAAVIKFQVRVNTPPPASISNQGTITYFNASTVTLQTDDPAVPGTADPTVVNAGIDLAISKTGTSSVNVGSNVSYTLKVWNNGGNTATGAVITDSVPSNISGVVWTCAATGTATCGTTSGSGNNLSLTANLPTDTGNATTADANYVTITVTGTAAVGGSITNTANVVPSGGSTYNEPNCSGSPLTCSGNNTSSQVTNITAPNLRIVKSNSGSFTIGSTGTYSIQVTNTGTVSTYGNITVRDTLPTGMTADYPSSPFTPGGTNGSNWSCSFDNALPQNVTCVSSTAISNAVGSNTSIFTFSVKPGITTTPGTNSVTNYASIGGGGDSFNGGSAPNPGSTCTDTNHCTSNSTTVLSPDLTIAKSHTGNFTRGSTGTYTLTVSNSPGTVATSGTVTVTDTLPTGLSVTAGSITPGGTNGANWTCSAVGQVITCTSTIAIAISGTSVFTLTVNVASNAASSVTNNVAVSGGNEATANNGNNSASDPTTIGSAPPNVSLVKSWTSPTCSSNCHNTNPPQLPGTDITFKIQFTNSGGSAATNLIIVDGVPNNMDYKLSSAAYNAGTTGLSFTIEFSSDYDPLNPTLATWTYTPISAGGGASAGYDRLVKAVRWTTAAPLPYTTPNNTSDVIFITKIR